jgi:predicted GNAT family N-acyltransferase
MATLFCSVSIEAVTLCSSDGQVAAGASNMGDGQWYLNRVVVKNGGRGKGLGSEALKRVIEEVRKQGGKQLIVEPGGYGSDPARLRVWYGRHGFEPAKDTVPGTPEFHMLLRITP